MTDKHPTQSQCLQIYGNPVGYDGNASPQWEAKNLVYVVPPYEMYMGSIRIRKIKVHKKVAESLQGVLNDIWEKCGKDQNVINKYKYNVFSGAYNFRNKRGAASLSMHAFGVAIDFDAPDNQMNDTTPLFKKDSIIVTAFESAGWTWGGSWSSGIDAMHFQYPTVR